MGLDTVVSAAFAVFMIFPMFKALRERLIYTTTVHMHRGVTHGALRLIYPLRLWCDYTLNRVGIWIRYWVHVHVKHHAKTDTVEDPHPPILLLYDTITDEGVRWHLAVEAHRKTNLAEYGAAATKEEVLAAKKPDVTFIDGWGKRLGVFTFVWLWFTHWVAYGVWGWLFDWLLRQFGWGGWPRPGSVPATDCHHCDRHGVLGWSELHPRELRRELLRARLADQG